MPAQLSQLPPVHWLVVIQGNPSGPLTWALSGALTRTRSTSITNSGRFLPPSFGMTCDTTTDTWDRTRPLLGLPHNIHRCSPRLEEVSGVFHLQDVGENPFPGTLQNRPGENTVPREPGAGVQARAAPDAHGPPAPGWALCPLQRT